MPSAKKSTKKFSELAREMATAKYWRPLLEAANLFSEDYGLDNILMLSGAIIRDPVVSERARQKTQRWMRDWSERVLQFDDSAIPDLPDDTYERVLREMSPADMRLLHDRLRRKARESRG
jgi:hypothetical protein